MKELKKNSSYSDTYPSEDEYENANRIFDELTQAYPITRLSGSNARKENSRKISLDDALSVWFSNQDPEVKKLLLPYYEALKIRNNALSRMENRAGVCLPNTENNENQWDAIFNTIITKMCIDAVYLQAKTKKLNNKKLAKNLFTEDIPFLFQKYEEDDLITEGLIRYACQKNPTNPVAFLEKFKTNVENLRKKYKEDDLINEVVIKYACQNHPNAPVAFLEKFKTDFEKLCEEYKEDDLITEGLIRYACQKNPNAPVARLEKFKTDFENFCKEYKENDLITEGHIRYACRQNSADPEKAIKDHIAGVRKIY